LAKKPATIKELDITESTYNSNATFKATKINLFHR
jgi:hypothetical protein